LGGRSARGQARENRNECGKKAVSKACSDQANAKNLHGKERKKFRAECKHKGGKVE
jgi:hypothetical protein